MSKYKLGFISDEDLVDHVRYCVDRYRSSITAAQIEKNILDPVKLCFDGNIYGYGFEGAFRQEVARQIDKSNNNLIGHFHQRIFAVMGRGWEVPSKGWDVVNRQSRCYVELKNKHNTMNSSSARATHDRMWKKVEEDSRAVCMLVEVIARQSQDEAWVLKVNNRKRQHERIRRVSIDRFYEIVTGQKDAFARFCFALPIVLKDVLESRGGESHGSALNRSTVKLLDEYRGVSRDEVGECFRKSFCSYQGFQRVRTAKV
jgi:hypothetical protein